MEKKYRLICINLKRRSDRRENMAKTFSSVDIKEYEFFDAVDGTQIAADDPRLNLLKHSVGPLLREGVAGCALSHYQLWQQLATDTDNDYYVIMEDDIRLSPNFKMGLDKILKQITDEMFIYLGIHMEADMYQKSREIYENDRTYSIHPLNDELYCGGLFGYIVTKRGALQLLEYINDNGIQMVIDYLTFRCGIPTHESHPHLVFSDCVQHSVQNVDSDIQRNYKKIGYTILENKYLFDDYVFYPNLDSVGGDIREVCADIPRLKRIADSLPECVAFNTYGWIKKFVALPDKYIKLENKYYTPDGLYVKKTCNRINNYQFDDYLFYPNKDSIYGDLVRIDPIIPQLKKMADDNPNCAGFNTYGWLKHYIMEPEKFIKLDNQYHLGDGLYVKKNYNQTEISRNLLNKKVEEFHKRMENGTVKIFVNEKALYYAPNIVKMVLKNFKKYIIVIHEQEYHISINHIMEEYYHYNKNAINILIGAEPWTTKYNYDIAIGNKYLSNSKTTIHYPFIFSSLNEHRRSINPKDYVRPKTKFCAYMYFRIHEHRIKYFNLLSLYKKVDGLGKCCNNVDVENTRETYTPEVTYNDIAVEYYANYKFVLAIENINQRGYCTEKLMNPIIANSIPIYWGDSEIFKYINKKRVIYINDFATDQELLEYIKYLDTHDDAYHSIINENIYTNPNFTPELFEREISNQISKELGF